MSSDLLQNSSNHSYLNKLRTPDELSTLEQSIHYFFIITSIVCSAFLVAAVLILRDCKRIQFQIKQLSYNCLLSEAVYHIVSVVLSVAILFLGQEYVQVVGSIRILAVICQVITLSSIASLTIERLMALCNTMRYTSVVNKRNVIIMSLHIWITHPVLIISAILSRCTIENGKTLCSTVDEQTILRLTLASLYIIYHSFIIVAYIKIRGVLKRHQKAITDTLKMVTTSERNKSPRKKKTATGAILQVILIFETLVLPVMIINALAFAIDESLYVEQNIKIAQLGGHAINIINTALRLKVYLLNIKECRYILYKIFLTWNKSSVSRLEEMRRSVYSIVLNE